MSGGGWGNTPDRALIFFGLIVALALPIHWLEELVLFTQVLHCQHHSPISSVVPIPAWVLESVCEQMDTSAL